MLGYSCEASYGIVYAECGVTTAFGVTCVSSAAVVSSVRMMVIG